MRKYSLYVLIIVVCMLVAVSGCKKDSDLNHLANSVVKSIQAKNAEKYYALFPNADQVAQYGIFAYGLYASSREDLKFWLRPYPKYHKSVDSLEKTTKPAAIQSIQRMFTDFHSTLAWDKVRLDGIDTTQSEIESISNLKKKQKEKSITTDMNIRLTCDNKKYLLICRGTFYIEGEGWFLRNAPSAIKLMEKK